MIKSLAILLFSSSLILGSTNALVLTRNIVDQMKLVNSTGIPSLVLAGMGITDIQAGSFDGPSIRDAQAIYLMGNSIKSFPSNLFQSLTSLKYLYAANNAINNLDSGFDCQGLEILDLSNNQISSIVPRDFSGLYQLKALYLYGNKLTSLDSEYAFWTCPNLQVLNLAHNQLSTIPANLFTHTSSIKAIDLSYNALTSIPDNSFDNLALTTLSLAGNCNLKASNIPAVCKDFCGAKIL